MTYRRRSVDFREFLFLALMRRNERLTEIGSRSLRQERGRIVVERVKVKACGVLVFRRQPELSFLVMKHHHRLDLPKGHVEAGEDETQCALRELWEETGIAPEQLELVPDFRYAEIYYPFERQYSRDRVEKTLVVFLGFIAEPIDIQITEHVGYDWLPWRPPHHVQKNTFNPLLTEVEQFFERSPQWITPGR